MNINRIIYHIKTHYYSTQLKRYPISIKGIIFNTKVDFYASHYITIKNAIKKLKKYHYEFTIRYCPVCYNPCVYVTTDDWKFDNDCEYWTRINCPICGIKFYFNKDDTIKNNDKLIEYLKGVKRKYTYCDYLNRRIKYSRNKLSKLYWSILKKLATKQQEGDKKW